MGERREVARRADAALLGHDRVDPGVEHRQQSIDEQRPAAAVAEGERVGAQEEHRPDDLARERSAHPRGVAHQQVLLQLAGLRGLDERRGEGTESGRHAVHHGALGDERLDDVARLLHPLARVRVEGRGRALPGDGLDVGDGQVGAGQDHGVGHVAEDSRLCSRPCSTS